MPSVHFNEIDETSASNFPKHNMMLSEEEEETATLAEPMTVEGAKQLAQSNVPTAPTPPAVLNISPGLPTVSPPILSSPRIIHPILPGGQLAASRSPMLHPLTSPPGTAPHPLLITGHLASPAAQFSVLSPGLWTPPNMSHDDEISEYPSTVDLQAIRDSPSPEPLSNEQATVNKSWSSQDLDISDSQAEDSSTDDESDSSDSDTSSSNSGSSSSDSSNKTEIGSDNSKTKIYKSNLLPRSQSTITDSESSDSESDKESDDDDDTSSNDESSASSDDDKKIPDIGFSKVSQPSATIHSIQQIISKESKEKIYSQSCSDDKNDQSQSIVSPISPANPKPLENPLVKNQTIPEKSVPVKDHTKSVKLEKSKWSGQVVSEDYKKKSNGLREKLPSSNKTAKQLNESMKVPASESDVAKKKSVQPRMYSPTELERRRIAKKKELDQEFDRLLKSSEERQESEGSDVDCALGNSDDVCSDSLTPVKPDCDKTRSVSKKALSISTSNTPASKLVSAYKDQTKTSTRGSHKCDEISEKTASKISSGASKCSARNKYYSTDSDDSSPSRENSPAPKKVPIRPTPPSPVQKTIADTVKIRERRTSLDTASSSGEKESDACLSTRSHRKKRTCSKSTEDSSLSDASEELNEKVDLDTEQTQTFSVSENNFNQGRLTMKIAAMKMAKFGKTGLREVTAGGFPTRSDSYGPFEGSDVMPKRHLNRNPKSEIQKVKTAAERKTYVDPVPTSSETNSRSKKKNNKDRMRVPASAFYRSANRNGEDQISRMADDLSEISDQHLGESLQVLNQDDLAALLSDENGHQAPNSVGLYNLKENHGTNHPRDSDLPDAMVQEAINSIALLTQNANVPLDGIFNEKSSDSTKKSCNPKPKVEQGQKRTDKVISHPNSPEESTQATHELETYTPLEHNALNVSPDSGIQSVNGSPLHPVGSPHHRSPFYSSGLIEAGISASNCGEAKASSEERAESSLNRSFSPTFSHRDSPSPPTLLPAVTPPHLCRSPRYYSDGPDSPPMPVLKCQVDHPPWEISDTEKPPETRPPSPKEQREEDKPKRSRGRPKGSKNLKKPLDQIWSAQTKDSSIEGSRRKSSKPLHLSNRNPIEHKILDSQEEVPVKRGPGRPKKVRDPESKREKIDGRKHRRLKIKRPVGRPRRQPATDSVDSKSLPVTLASRKCFSEKIMHKIINEKVRNSEKSDKLAVEGKEEDLPSELHGLKDRRSEDERGRKTKRKSLAKKLCGDGIPLIEERKKKRGRRKELPAIFGKVYGSVKFVEKGDHARGISPGSHSSFKKKKKHKKSFKSKHKNIIDPVFLAELEDLMVDFSSKCAISKPPNNPVPVTGEAPLPSIFRRRKVVLPTKKKSRIDKVKTIDKESGTEGDVREKLAGKRKKKVLEPPKQGRERSEANEQRLPLKKRHRHISTGVSVCTDPPKMEQSKPDSVKNLESKDKSTIAKAPLDSVKNIKAENKASKSNQETKLDTTPTTKKKAEAKSSAKDQNPNDILPAKFTPLNISYEEENRKKDATYQSMVSTTPKKRHRLEADAKKKSIEQSIESPSVLLQPEPVNIKSSQVVTRIKVEQESEKTSENEVSSCIENVTEPIKCSIPPCETAFVKSVERVDEGTHSDSDIPSEHEPLGESDHSGFMSDKEENSIDDTTTSPKRRKRKREYRLPNKIAEESPKETKDVKVTPPVHRKKRRKTNRTGFPTIRRKKKIKLDSKENESPVVLTSDQAASLDPKVCIEPLSISDAAKFSQIKSENFEAVRPRGRPRKAPCVEDLKLKPENDDGKSRKRKEIEDDPKPTDNKKPKKIGEEEVDDSDALPVSEISSEPISSDECSRVSSGRQKAPRFKKKYLVAGLLSNYYKQDDFSQRKNTGTCGRPKLQYEPQQHVHGLLPPPSYCKKQLRETVIDFTLPYDLWWLNKHNRLPGRDPVPSWNYKKVKANVYYDVKPTHEFDIQACNCKKPQKPDAKSCDEDCINRVMFIECSPQTCPVNDTCSNQRLQKHENLTCLQKFKTEDKGWGIKATTKIKQGSFIMEYVGEVVSEKEFRYRMQTRYVNDTHHYCLNLDRGMMIDGHRIGSDCRFVNHSCAPNCEMQKWNVNGQYRMALFALKDIPESDELTYDYNFHLFNPAQGQPCKCREENCRGVIGGRSQRVNVTPPEEKRKSSGRNKKEASKKRKRGASTDTEGSCVSRSQFMPMKPLSHQQRLFILSHRCFLLRNLEKIRKSRDRVTRYQEKKVEEPVEPTEEPCNKIQRFQTHFTALNTARSVKTRRLAQVEDDPEMTRLAKLAQIFKDIYDKLFASRDDKDKPLATPFMTVPSKKKYPAYYSRVGEPIDLSLIEKNISTGHYTSVESFDGDVMRLFANNLRFFGRNTEIGQMAVGLRRVYSECKLQFKPLLEEVLGEDHLPAAFSDSAMNEEFEDEDVIRCVCNLYRDEGTMIQCERCLVWQHCDCMSVNETDFPEHYLCEECSPRIVSPEVPMTPQPADSSNKKHFITLLRDNLQIKQGDSVYILRDRPAQKTGERRQPAYKLAKDVKLHELLIFKVESLFIDEKGDKYAFGHHYLRPHETFHEPMRKFYANEVIRSPYCEILALDMIIKHCWVMDLNSYCRGRPIGAVEEHVYVCEFRVDKSAHVFSKISKPKYPICKKPYAFITFQEKLRPQKTYTPHEVIFSRRSKHSSSKLEKMAASVKEEGNSKISVAPDSAPATPTPPSRNNSGTRKCRSNASSRDRSENEAQPEEPPPPVKDKATDRTSKRVRVNQVATRLLRRLPTKGAVDLAYLLENNKRQRKKTTAFAS